MLMAHMRFHLVVNNLGRELRAMRKEAGLSQQQLSEKILGPHRKRLQSRISRLETGKAPFLVQDVAEQNTGLERNILSGHGIPYIDTKIQGATAPPFELTDDEQAQLRGRLGNR
jgi:transcriptional regulator with XRE-family HTH domain